MKKVPKSLAKCADLLYETREERYKLQRLVDALADYERDIKDYIIKNLPKNDATGIAGKVARIQLTRAVHPQAEDWAAIYEYIKDNDAFELLQRRLNSKAIKEIWDDEQTVPGVVRFNSIDVSCTKLEPK